MDRLSRLLRAPSRASLIAITAAVTLFCVASAVGALATLFHFLPPIPSEHYWKVLAVSAAIPLLIAPPVTFAALSILRVLAETIDKVDAHARYDALTGALNRASFLHDAERSLAQGGAFLMIDADRFKQINDTYGHDVGDEALKHLARTLRATLPAEAALGRLGGEEFGVALPRATAALAALCADRLCAAMRRDGSMVAGKPLGMTVSVGVAEHRGGPLKRAIKRADEALYAAKRAGRDGYVFAESDKDALHRPTAAA
jgi:diguanylate cyclase (GGDEF)-like protein